MTEAKSQAHVVVPRLVRRSLCVGAVGLGTSSVVAHALEYWDRVRFAKDFGLEYASARAILDRADPYAPMRELVVRYLHVSRWYADSFIVPGRSWHPPFKLVMTVPLAALPYRAAGVLWLLLSAASIVAAIVLVGGALGWPRRTSVIVGIGVLALPVVQKDLSFGQVNGPLLLMLAAGWRLLNARRDVPAGIIVGLAAATKFFPALVLLTPLTRRRWRAVSAAALSFLVLTGASAAIIGPAHLRGFFHGGAPEGFRYWEAAPTNISLWGLVMRWVGPNGWTPNLGLRTLAIALGLTGIALLVRHAVRSADYWSAVPVMLLAWPIVWDHYLVLLLPWGILTGSALTADGRRGALAEFALVGAALSIGIPPGVPPLFHRVPPWAVAFLFQLPTSALLATLAIDARARRIKMFESLRAA